MSDKERLEIVADNLEKFWAAIADDQNDAEMARILREDAQTLREIATRAAAEQ